MAAGRPSDCDAERIGQDIINYLEECKAHSYVPTVEGLAVHLSMGRTAIYRSREEHPAFRDILEQLLALQASMLIQNGLKGRIQLDHHQAHAQQAQG